MKPMVVDYLADMEDQHGGSSTMAAAAAMEVDDMDSIDLFGEGPLSSDHLRLADADFFNSFQDDFDDSDIY